MKKEEKIDALNKGIKIIKTFPTAGLCYLVHLLYGTSIYIDYPKVISYAQKKYLLSIIPKVTTSNKFHPFYWKKFAKAPRVRFLQEQIKKLEKK